MNTDKHRLLTNIPWLNYLLIALMMACLAASVVQFGQRVSPGWQGSYLPWVCLLISLEAMYSWRSRRGISFLDAGRWTYHAVELVVILLLLKICIYLLHSPAQLWTDLSLWRQDFFSHFFAGEYLFAALTALFIWSFSVIFASDLADLEADETLISGQAPVGIASQRMEVRQQLIERIIVFGIVMVVLTGLVRMDLRALWGMRPPLRVGVFNVLFYFFLALVLLNQTQFAILRAGWYWERIPFGRDFGKRWTIYGLLFLIILVGLVILLPTRYSLGLLSVLGYLLSLLIFFIMAIWALILYLLSSLIGLLNFLHFRLPFQAPKVTLPTPPPPSEFIPMQPVHWMELLKSLFFWIVFIAVVGFSLFHYFKQNRQLWEKLRRIPGFPWLVEAWGSLRAWWRGASQAVTQTVGTTLRRLLPQRQDNPDSPWRFVNPRRLPPRSRILFYYLALVRRGSESGLPRRNDQTPYEYRAHLRTSLPEVDAEIASMTEAFVEARYSRHTITTEQAGRVHRWWQQVRRALLASRKHER